MARAIVMTLPSTRRSHYGRQMLDIGVTESLGNRWILVGVPLNRFSELSRGFRMVLNP
jgi:hypothetical protein